MKPAATRIVSATVLLGTLAGAACGAGSAEVRVGTTPTGLRYGTWGGPETGPAATLVVLATTVEGTLGDAYFRQAGGILGDPSAEDPVLCVSIDLPCHGTERREGEPPELEGWRHRLEQGDDPVGDAARRIAGVLDHLVATGRTDPKRIAVAGTSRGGFMALQIAARDPRVACAVAYSPVTDLAALREFRGAESLPAVKAAAVHEQAGRLAGRPVWIAIGGHDERVGTDRAEALAAAIHAAAAERQVPDRCTLIVDPESQGHTTPPGAAGQSAAWIRGILAGRAGAGQATQVAQAGRAAAAGRPAAPVRRRRVLYNFDGCSCMFTKAGGKGPVPITLDDVKRLIEEVASEGSRVDTVLVCVNAQVMYYPTTEGTMLGQPPSQAEGQWLENLRAFYARGIDPYAVMLAEARARGREALVSFRMNDDHGTEPLRTQFLVDHPDWRLGAAALDFGRAEVREHTFRLIEECVRRYDCDGLELDFNRFPRFFTDTTPEAERVGVITALVERVRALLDEVGRERGRRLVFCVRVPSNFNREPPTPATARGIGCDVPAWAAAGWLDFVTVSEWLLERGDLPIAAWREAMPGVPVYGGIECVWADRPEHDRQLSADDYRRAARRLVEHGADGIYLFNFFTTREPPSCAEPPFAVLGTLGDPVEER